MDKLAVELEQLKALLATEQAKAAQRDLEMSRLYARQAGIEVFFVDRENIVDGDFESKDTGWYWWSCHPGCLPDSDAIGPFGTEAEALAAIDMRDGK